MKKELLRVGVWKKTVTITLKRLKELVKNFNNETGKTADGYKIPLFLGHPDEENKAPAKGWLTKVWLDGKSIFGEFSHLTEDTLNEIKTKAFRDVSVGIMGNRWRHVALTNTPAVSHLGDFFNKDENCEIINLSQIKEEQMDQELKDALKKVSDLEVKNESIMGQLETANAKVTELTAELTETKEKLTESEKKFSDKDKEYNQLVEDGEKAKEQLADEKDVSFVDGLIKERKLRPVDREITLSNMRAQRGAEEINFTDGDGKQVKKAPLDAYRESLEAADEILEPGEKFTHGQDKQGTAEDKLIKLTKEYMEKNNMDYATASTVVLNKHPELNKAV